LQHFVEDEAFRLEQVLIGGASVGCPAVSYLFVEFGEGE
jgi:hypothetical protein